MTDQKNLSTRGRMWQEFAKDVLEHIETYTVPQYGDYPDDLASTWDEDRMLDEIRTYMHRAKSALRPDCRFTDLLKMAHIMCMIYTKRRETA